MPPIAIDSVKEGIKYFDTWLSSINIKELFFSDPALKNEVIYVAKSDDMRKIVMIGLKLKKIRYDILSKITFGKMRRHYKYKKEKYSILLKGLKESKG